MTSGGRTPTARSGRDVLVARVQNPCDLPPGISPRTDLEVPAPVLAQTRSLRQPGSFALAFAETPKSDDGPSAPLAETDVPAPATSLPSHTSGPPDEIWEDYFAKNHPTDNAVRRVVLRLTTLGEHEHVIQLIQAALIHGQSQPWMYEVLADSMAFAGRPESEIQRVVMSLTDFGNANLESMMISGAYLTRFGRDAAALRMYRQASRMAPERAEPYILGLRLARKLQQPEGVGWAAAGILQYAWTSDAEQLHREAENAALQAEEWLLKAGKEQAAQKLKASIAEAQRCDLRVTLTWNGTADLDLLVEEPAGTVCSFQSPETIGGGIHLHDGYGPIAANCVETYVCPLAVSGEYKLRVRHVFGKVVGKRAQLTITRHIGSDQQSSDRQTLVLTGEDSLVTFRLEDGRRTQPRSISSRHLNPQRAQELAENAQSLRRPERLTAEQASALRRFQEGRSVLYQQVATQTMRPFVTGVVGLQPVVTNLNEGAVLRTNAIVSPDRRYVRIAVNPVFSTLTDVFTFSFVSGIDPFGGRNTGLGGN